MTNNMANKQEFNIIGVSRDDIHSLGIETSGLTDKDMADIAETMRGYYTEGQFWGDLEQIVVDDYNLKKHTK